MVAQGYFPQDFPPSMALIHVTTQERPVRRRPAGTGASGDGQRGQTVDETNEGGSIFLIADGKSENAKRVVPVTISTSYTSPTSWPNSRSRSFGSERYTTFLIHYSSPIFNK